MCVFVDGVELAVLLCTGQLAHCHETGGAAQVTEKSRSCDLLKVRESTLDCSCF